MLLFGESSDAETLGNRIRRARERAGLKQAELAEAIGRCHDAISKMERDRRHPRFDEMIAIAIATQQPLKFFVEVVDEYQKAQNLRPVTRSAERQQRH